MRKDKTFCDIVGIKKQRHHQEMSLSVLLSFPKLDGCKYSDRKGDKEGNADEQLLNNVQTSIPVNVFKEYGSKGENDD